ncbi:uncharacterized protein [Triticum aestivum]|uniref:uncharacterized protein isoform X1 n=1 Tax=Triticum aestivum TaxID=4565 RepID=UPI000844B179|nr:uncharacterized protein LOC123188726 isoform X1 [Triticum aestivum]
MLHEAEIFPFFIHRHQIELRSQRRRNLSFPLSLIRVRKCHVRLFAAAARRCSCSRPRTGLGQGYFCSQTRRCCHNKLILWGSLYVKCLIQEGMVWVDELARGVVLLASVGRSSARKKKELHPAYEVQPVSMCSPTARVCLCPVHGRTVCGACMHTEPTCGVRRSQAKKKNTLRKTGTERFRASGNVMAQPLQYQLQQLGAPGAPLPLLLCML